MEHLVLFSGTSLEDFPNETTIYGSLISVKGYPYRFIQNDEGITTPVKVGSEKIQINGEWIDVRDLGRKKDDYITRSKLELLGFKYDNVINEYNYDVFFVKITEEESEPEIWMTTKNMVNDMHFPGAYTLKDLKDLMFFYYGEQEYTKRFGHLPIEIVD